MHTAARFTLEDALTDHLVAAVDTMVRSDCEAMVACGEPVDVDRYWYRVLKPAGSVVVGWYRSAGRDGEFAEWLASPEAFELLMLRTWLPLVEAVAAQLDGN